MGAEARSWPHKLVTDQDLRITIGDEVVGAQQQNVTFGPAAQEIELEQRACFNGEGLGRSGIDSSPDFRIGKLAEVCHDEAGAMFVLDHLAPAVLALDEAGSQGLMPFHDLAECELQAPVIDLGADFLARAWTIVQLR